VLDIVDQKSGAIVNKVSLSGHLNNIAVTKEGLVLAGGEAFEAGLIFRVPASSRFFEGAEGLAFLLRVFNSAVGVNPDRPLSELTDSHAPRFQVLKILPLTQDVLKAGTGGPSSRIQRDCLLSAL
jgi:hypothetical protein